MSEEWCTIESDPGVFSELISLFGVQDVAVEEIYSLDDMIAVQDENIIPTTYGYVFLFKWKKELQNDGRIPLDPANIPELFFARQIATNACATQAILSVLLNADGINLGSSLEEFRSFTMLLDSESKGLAIGNFEQVRLAHNSFARPDPFLVEQSAVQQKDGEDPYHFVAYLPHQGRVYEIDGLKSGPIDLGAVVDGDWNSVARPAIQAQFDKYSGSETHFALLKICTKRKGLLERHADVLRERLLHIPPDIEEFTETQQQLLKYQDYLREEMEKERQQSVENQRRRHNYVPMIVELLVSLAKAGKLHDMITKATTNSGTRINA